MKRILAVLLAILFVGMLCSCGETVDHILCPEGVVPTYYDTVVDQDALEASDHCPIYADFAF